MAHLFCPSCGNKLTYAHAQPNFCGKCGNQLNVSASTNTSAGLPKLEKSVAISQDETDSKFVPHIEDFQVEVETPDNKTFTLGSLLGESSTPNQEKRGRKLSIDEFIDEKKQEG